MNDSLEKRLNQLFDKVLADRKINKRLRYTQALIKLKTEPSEKQAIMLMTDICLLAVKEGIELEATDEQKQIFAAFFLRLLREAWNSGTLEENFSALKLAREKTK